MLNNGSLLANVHLSYGEQQSLRDTVSNKRQKNIITIAAVLLLLGGVVCACALLLIIVISFVVYRYAFGNSWSAPHTSIQYKMIPGVDSNLLSLDIYNATDTTTLRPVVMYIHGGAWIIGDKKNKLENKFNLFQSLNYVFISVNYRLSPNPPQLSNPNRIQYPIHNLDVADAVQWVKNNIAAYGGNPSKIALLGHSAGAHLVSLSGTSPLFLPPRQSEVQCVASIDTEGYDIVTQSTETLYLNAFGSNATIWTEASPTHNVVTGGRYPKFFIAKRGSTTRMAIADAFYNKLLSAGVDARQITANEYDHEGINEAIGAKGETIVTTPLTQFFQSCFA